MTTRWLPIPAFPGYAVSSRGSVRRTHNRSRVAPGVHIDGNSVRLRRPDGTYQSVAIVDLINGAFARQRRAAS